MSIAFLEGAEYEAAMQNSDLLITTEVASAKIAELQAQLAAALATIERAVVAPEADAGALYAEGCAP